ncbi:Gfo/Idh/MocA family oxidoreductase, partial [Acinetobacter baumannii]
DLVVVAVPTRHHGEIAGDSLRAGAHVLIEKPMTATDAEAQRLMAIAADHGRRIGVGHSERFNPVVIALKRHWPQIGRVFQLTIRRLGP